MMARIVTQKPDPGNRVGLHYSPFQQSSPIRAPSIQLLARARSTQNRILEQPIREVGLESRISTTYPKNRSAIRAGPRHRPENGADGRIENAAAGGWRGSVAPRRHRARSERQ